MVLLPGVLAPSRAPKLVVLVELVPFGENDVRLVMLKLDAQQPRAVGVKSADARRYLEAILRDTKSMARHRFEQLPPVVQFRRRASLKGSSDKRTRAQFFSITASRESGDGARLFRSRRLVVDLAWQTFRGWGRHVSLTRLNSFH
jgi:hypothetical protein